MLKQITTEGFIVDKQLVRKLGKVGILLSYYIDCYKFYADESGVFYRSRTDIRNDTTISYEAQQAYEKKLVELGLLDITYGNVAQSNRIKLHPESIILYRDAQTTSVVAQTKTFTAQTISVMAQTKTFMAQTKTFDTQTNSLVSQRIPTDKRTERTTDAPTDTQLTPYEMGITLSFAEINNIKNLPDEAIAILYPKYTQDQINYCKHFTTSSQVTK